MDISTGALCGAWQNIPLPAVLRRFRRYNRPLAMAIKAIASSSSGNPDLSVIDVGATSGRRVAVIEQMERAGLESYLLF